MPSASNSPIIGRKSGSESPPNDVESTKRGPPLSVASMVRRFERDNGLDKSRGGGENQGLSRTSSLSSSQGHLTGGDLATGTGSEQTSETSEGKKQSESGVVKKASSSSVKPQPPQVSKKPSRAVTASTASPSSTTSTSRTVRACKIFFPRHKTGWDLNKIF